MNPCVMCGQHDANPTQYFEDELYTWCDTHQENFNLSEFDSEIRRLEEIKEEEELTRHVMYGNVASQSQEREI